jgi:hypothetical protein
VRLDLTKHNRNKSRQNARFDTLIELSQQANATQERFQEALLNRLEGKANHEEGPAAAKASAEIDPRVAEWLESLNYGKYASIFSKHQTTMEELVYLDFNILKGMGIPLPAAKRMEAKIKKLD